MPMNDARRLVLILGGARSGKSTFAEQLAAAMPGPIAYLATATVGDDEEMRRRVAVHRQARPAEWQTVEEPTDLAAGLRQAEGARTILLDCVTLWAANVLLGESTEEAAEVAVDGRLDDFLAAYEAGKASVIAVSNEVGLGLVPPYPLGRLYRDVLGRVNQRLAARADTVYLMIAGLPVEIKALAAATLRALPALRLHPASDPEAPTRSRS
ncbi:MAG: bifunctional adenosylcobinamide kinase/adenosylcobinamide-phosphate guanylyltransferase [Chloroflexi bacterium]|nr:bifunctional adenosylcobinamide kinase/adenosylcobinamide-phosphate guanylyltransferase [Chloroflexota bacterium]